MSPKIRILIADDHKVVAEGLRHLLAIYDDLDVVAIVRDGRDAVAKTRELEPAVVIMDSDMPELNGIEATREITRRSPEARVVMLSVHCDPLHVVRALRAGAAGYVPKSSAGEDVVDAIRLVNVGRRYIHPSIEQEVLHRLVQSDAGDDPIERLSAREAQVLQLIAEGRSASEIAASLSVSSRTVETYRARLMEKLGIRDLPGLVKFAIQHRITTL